MILDRIAGAARRRVEEKKRIKPLDLVMKGLAGGDGLGRYLLHAAFNGYQTVSAGHPHDRVISQEGIARPFFPAFNALQKVKAAAPPCDAPQQGDGCDDVCVYLAADWDDIVLAGKIQYFFTGWDNHMGMSPFWLRGWL